MKIVSAFPDPIPVASSVDFPTFFDKVINEYESNIALIDQEANISYKFSELRFLINRFSIFLEKLPLKQGDIVATLLGNSAEFIALFLACCKQRLVFTPLNPNYHRREIETYLLKVSPQYLIVEDNLYNESAYLPSIVKSINSVYRINELMLFTSPTGERDGNYELEPFDNSATAVIFFSSGTSGFPKPTKISHKALITQINIVRCIEENAIQDFLVLGCSDVSYGVMPYCHSGGLMATLMMIAQGAKVLINRKFNEDSFYQHIEKYKVTTLTLVPAVMCLFLNSEKTKNYDLTSIKNIFFGSSNIHVDVLDRLKKKFTHITNYIHLYGLTEANIVFMMPNIEAAKKKITSVGVLMPGVQCRIISISPNDLDSDVETLEEGELYIKSDMVMNGYLNEEDNANAFDEGNWLKTGDIVSVDRDGFFYIKGRCKELIKINSWQISPFELETAILDEFKEEVEDCAILHYIDNPSTSFFQGQLAALVILKPNKFLLAHQITTFIEKNFISYKHIKGGVKFVTSFPKTETGKLLRIRLAQLFINSV